MELKSPQQIRKLSTKQLIDYKHALEKRSEAIAQEVADFTNNWNYVQECLKDRLEELEYSLIEAECDRIEADVYTIHPNLEIH